MPFIDSKITVPLSDEKKEKIKTELGKAIIIARWHTELYPYKM